MRHAPKPFTAVGITRLERMRRFHGLTLREMAAKTGTPRSTLARILNGYLPDVGVGMRIAKSFDVTVEDVWGELPSVK